MRLCLTHCFSHPDYYRRHLNLTGSAKVSQGSRAIPPVEEFHLAPKIIRVQYIQLAEIGKRFLISGLQRRSRHELGDQPANVLQVEGFGQK